MLRAFQAFLVSLGWRGVAFSLSFSLPGVAAGLGAALALALAWALADLSFAFWEARRAAPNFLGF